MSLEKFKRYGPKDSFSVENEGSRRMRGLSKSDDAIAATDSIPRRVLIAGDARAQDQGLAALFALPYQVLPFLPLCAV